MKQNYELKEYVKANSEAGDTDWISFMKLKHKKGVDALDNTDSIPADFKKDNMPCGTTTWAKPWLLYSNKLGVREGAQSLICLGVGALLS